jgi:GTPase Era involved in 16S rRNA processing
MSKNIEEPENFEHDNLTEKEKEEAKQNGFILVGKTGAGKTTILNAIFNKVMGKVEKSAISVTKISTIYYYKLTNGKVVCLVDTPGLADTEKTEKKNIDNIHLEGITKVISDSQIHIKGILFLVNFQSERFDASEQEALLNYNTVFPLKSFWKSLALIYTHFYSDPNEDEDEESMKESRRVSNGEIFEKLMEKVKGVSDPISYNDLKIKYCNSYSEAKNNNKKKKNNDKTREELESLFDEISKNPPLFNQVEVQHITNHRWTEEDGNEYIGEVEIIYFFDLNKEPIKKRMNIIKKEKVIKQQSYPSSYTEHYVYNATRSSGGYINYQRQEANKSNSRVLKSLGSGIVTGALGAIGAAAFISMNLATAGVGGAIGLGIGALFGLFK